jgi:hypothetical protein
MSSLRVGQRRSAGRLRTQQALHAPRNGGDARWEVRPAYARAVPLALTLLFALYGLAFDALCSLFVPQWRPWALSGVALLGVPALVVLVFLVARGLRARYRKRIEQLGDTRAVSGVRRLAFAAGLSLRVVVPIGLIAWEVAAPLLHFEAWAFDSHRCPGPSARGGAWFQLIAAIVLTSFAVILGPRWVPRWKDRLAGCLLVTFAGIGLYVLTDESATEAAYGPYPTAFGALAAVLVTVVSLLASWAAPIVVRGSAPIDGPLLQRALRRCELFGGRQEPQLSVDRVVYALIGAPLTQPLLLLVVPSFAAVVSGRRQLWWVWWIHWRLHGSSSRWEAPAPGGAGKSRSRADGS